MKIEGHIYVIQFSTGTIKVGRSCNPTSRLAAHASSAASHGVKLSQHEISARVFDLCSAERDLISWCMENSSGRQNNEWFSGVDFCSAVEAMRSIAAFYSSDSVRAELERQKNAAHAAIEEIEDRLRSEGHSIAKWHACMSHAKTMQAVIQDDAFGGAIFYREPGGCSFFEICAAISMSELDESGIAILYADAVNDPESCIDFVISSYRRIAAEHADA